MSGQSMQFHTAVAVVCLYAASWAKGVLTFRRTGFNLKQAAQASALIVLSKFCNLQGYATYWIRRTRNIRSTLIEYK